MLISNAHHARDRREEQTWQIMKPHNPTRLRKKDQ